MFDLREKLSKFVFKKLSMKNRCHCLFRNEARHIHVMKVSHSPKGFSFKFIRFFQKYYLNWFLNKIILQELTGYMKWQICCYRKRQNTLVCPGKLFLWRAYQTRVNSFLQRYNHIISTHLPFHWLYKEHVETGGKIIYVIRNPKDVAVSLYKILDSCGYIPSNETFEDFVASSYLGQCGSNNYHILKRNWDMEKN